MGKSVAVIGAGPVGLAAAAHLLERGLEPVVLEAGPAVGHAVRAVVACEVFLAVGIRHRQGLRAAARADGLEFPRPARLSHRRRAR